MTQALRTLVFAAALAASLVGTAGQALGDEVLLPAVDPAAQPSDPSGITWE